MNDNRNHIGPNWNGRSPRTMEEAFKVPTEVTVKEKVTSIAMLVAFVLVMAFFMGVGSHVF